MTTFSHISPSAIKHYFFIKLKYIIAPYNKYSMLLLLKNIYLIFFVFSDRIKIIQKEMEENS